MSKKKSFLTILESQIDKIILGVIVLVSLALLWLYVIGGPYGAKIKIGSEIKVSPGNIDKKVKDEAQLLLGRLQRSAPSTEYDVYNKTYLEDYTDKLVCSIPDVPMELAVPYPGVGQEAIEEDRLYAVPGVPSLDEVHVAVLRGAAEIPVDEVSPGTPYDSVETKLEDIDLVTLSGRFDFERLYSNFQLRFSGPGLKSSWKDSQLAKPVFARIELQRRTKQDDGSWSAWSNVPRAKIDMYKKLLEQLPLRVEDMQFGVDVWISQYEADDVQLDLLQPEPYLFGVSRTEWMPPEYLIETDQILQKEAEQLRRQKIEERKKKQEAERKRRTPGGRDGGGGMLGMPGGGGGMRPGGGDRRTGRSERERIERTTARRAERERTLQDVERDVQKDTLKEETRLESLREPALIWVHDDTVQPGQTYQYRVRVGVFNPIAGKNWFQKDEIEFKDQTVLWSMYSELPETVEIPKMLHVFPMEVLAKKDDSKEIEGLTVEVAKYEIGQWHSHEFAVYPGQIIGYPAEDESDDEEQATEAVGMMMRGTDKSNETKVDYTSGLTLVDIINQVHWGSGTAPRRMSFNNMLYANVDGLSQEAIGKKNWSVVLKKAYKDVQDAMAENVEERKTDRINPVMPGMPGMLPQDMMLF